MSCKCNFLEKIKNNHELHGIVIYFILDKIQDKKEISIGIAGLVYIMMIRKEHTKNKRNKNDIGLDDNNDPELQLKIKCCENL